MPKDKKKIVCHDVYGKFTEVDPEVLEFRPSVYGILIEDKKILLSRQWDGYDFPGGGAEVYETIEETLKREFFEETGVQVEAVMPIHCQTSYFQPAHSKKNKHKYWNNLLVFYTVKKTGGRLSKDNFDEDEKGYADLPEWVSLDKAPDIKFINPVNSPAVIRQAIKLSGYSGPG